MGCFAFIVMLFLMVVGTIAWLEGSLWIPALCWTLAAMAGGFCAMLFSFPSRLDEVDEPPLE